MSVPDSITIRFVDGAPDLILSLGQRPEERTAKALSMEVLNAYGLQL